MWIKSWNKIIKQQINTISYFMDIIDGLNEPRVTIWLTGDHLLPQSWSWWNVYLTSAGANLTDSPCFRCWSYIKLITLVYMCWNQPAYILNVRIFFKICMDAFSCVLLVVCCALPPQARSSVIGPERIKRLEVTEMCALWMAAVLQTEPHLIKLSPTRREGGQEEVKSGEVER